METEQKYIWIVNPYTIPGTKRTRQIVLSQRLREHGYKVTIVCGSQRHGTTDHILNDNERYKIINFDGEEFIILKTITYSGNGGKRVLASILFQHAVWNMRHVLPIPDVIVSDFAGLFGNIFLKFKKKYNTKIIYDVLDLWPEDFIDVGYIKKDSISAKILYSMEHKSYRDADGIIFSFEGGKDYIIEKGWDTASGGDIDINKVGYLNNGVDLETIDKNKTEMVLDDADLDTDKFKATYLGSIRRANDLDVIIEAARVLQERQIDNVVLLIYGDGDHREALEKKATEYQLKNIKFKGLLPVEYAPNMLSRCDVSIFNFMDVPITRFGLSPNKLFMYFASGKPVLATLEPKYDLVSGRNCGIVVGNKPEAIADGIAKFMQIDIAEYEKYAQNCRQVAEEFDYKNLVKVLIKQIEGTYVGAK